MKSFNRLLQTAVLGGAVLIAGWWTLYLRGKLTERDQALEARDSEIATLAERVGERELQISALGDELQQADVRILELDAEVAKRERELVALQAAMKLLKIDHRLARIEVLGQGATSEDPEALRTLVRFTELDPEGQPVGPGVELTVEGKVVYVETLVIKFGDDYVEQGDALRGTSICLFRRLFGENQKPNEGEPIDAAGAQPLIYASDAGPDPFYDELWSRFWDYANDADLARSKGVRAIHGEAPFIELRPGQNYRVELRSSGGLTIKPEE